MGDMIFKPAARYPADPRAVFILALSVFSGLTALALRVAPESLDALLPEWGVLLWGGILTMGSVITLGGMAFQTVNGIIAEQIGSVMVGAATIFYAGLAYNVIGPSSIQNVSIVLAWGIACFIRWLQLQILIHNGVKRAQKVEMLHKIFAQIEEREGLEARQRAERRAHRGGLL